MLLQKEVKTIKCKNCGGELVYDEKTKSYLHMIYMNTYSIAEPSWVCSIPEPE
ncbi:MAG: hypothetical protein QXL94_01175 [Candidatus Parvarchaeum sp.]